MIIYPNKGLRMSDYELNIVNISGDKIIHSGNNETKLYTVIKNKIFYIDAKISPKISNEMKIKASILLDIQNLTPVPLITDDICNYKIKMDKNSGMCQLKMKLNILSRNYQNNNFRLKIELLNKYNVLCSSISNSIRVISKEPKTTNNTTNKRKNTTNNTKIETKSNDAKKLKTTSTQNTSIINNVTPLTKNNPNKENISISTPSTPKSTLILPTNNNNNNKENMVNQQEKLILVDNIAEFPTTVVPSKMVDLEDNKTVLDQINDKQDTIIFLLEALNEKRSPSIKKESPYNNMEPQVLQQFFTTLFPVKNSSTKTFIKTEETFESAAQSPTSNVVSSPSHLNNFVAPSNKIINSFKEFTCSLGGVSSQQRVSYLKYLFSHCCDQQDKSDFLLSLQEEKGLAFDPNVFLNHNSNSIDSFESFFQNNFHSN
eukprot:TRINITY_DN17101_c0_g1_i1.p1 TRINITY_DN17101_c0_g1~~TRINITY_DN17101_c0_g1_i1.p1  ORF type:complete len:430 (+),score=108.43 TRINITY_DN17101_c0_g1_i1:1357-2646(+)